MEAKKASASYLSGQHAPHSVSHYLTVTTVAAVELLVKRFWHQIKARVWGVRSLEGASPGTWAPSPAMRLPQEIVEMIIAHLITNLPCLHSCSLTCYSWYIAAVPHLHPTLSVYIHSMDRKFRWPDPIRHMHRLGLLPFVKTVRMHNIFMPFSPKLLNRRILPQFLALTKVQRLEIGRLDIPSFMPSIQQNFGHFLPTVRSLRLTGPRGSHRQILFFIGSFQHLDDLSLEYRTFYKGEPEDDPTLIPPFAPPLRGHLLVQYWPKAGFFRDMVHLFGEIRFRSMDLLDVDETRFLLHACAKTLRVLQLHPHDSLGEPL